METQPESSQVNRLQELINGFSIEQLQYLAKRPFVRYDKDAAKLVGVSPETVSRWGNKAEVDEAVLLMAADGVIVAGEILRRHLPEAAQEMVDELTSKRVDVRHKAAKEVLDRGGVSTTQKIEHSGSVDANVGADPKLAEFMALVDTARARQGDTPTPPDNK